MSLRRRPDKREAQTFTQLYEQHLDAVFNYCRFRIQDRQMPEDLTAETFEQAWRDRHRYNPERASFTTWLFAIARHRIVDKQRELGQKTLIALDGQLKDELPLPEEQVAEQARLAKRASRVQQLPEEHQELVALKFGAGLTNRRMAELLGKGESAVGSALYRIMQRLRQQWEEENVQVPRR
jgi:RNA polymerase sigma-70 factor, ECF subfamily